MLKNLIKKMQLIQDWFKLNESMKLRQLSNSTIEEAALNSDKVLGEISLIAYSLHKLLSKPHIVKSKNWNKVKLNILNSLNKSINFLKKKNFDQFEKELDRIALNVSSIDSRLSNYIQNIYEKARIKQASRAYGFGLSLSQAQKLTNANKKDLLNYIGITRIHEKVKAKKGINERLKALKEVF